ncbi:MAG TPA: tetratricopeptide repeat-containing glycosyltransferase family 2 protein [Candidatus Wunengus sp. YC63]|uniref:tetratricopeptide repeat-containing glycosyltransferase family 2 protein n=1 Tax=Candidatus Wunengus sp. YC63 TaxID=3367699 RepID=UPI0040289472
MENILSPKISACMIVKNEEEFLPNCLNSIKDVVDEIIIVDTGSTDNTVTIAKEFKAKVYHHPWNDSFSEARNHCLNHASGDWILQIDADEELERSDIPILRDAINTDSYNGIIIAIHSIVKDGTHKFYHPRIFRRGKGFYKDIIHEQTIIEGERLPTEIRLYHYGYNLDEKKMRIKWQRTTHLLKKQIAQNKHDSFAWFNLVRNYRIQDSFQDGINAGEEALKIMSPVPFSNHDKTDISLHHYVMIIYETANCHLYNEDYSKAKELCHFALSKLAELKIEPENIDLIFTLACIYLKEGDYRKAIDYFERFLLLREWYLKNINKISLMVDTMGYDYTAYNGLGICSGKLGHLQTAIDYLQKAIASNTKYLTPYKNLALCYLSEENLVEATNTLLRTISEGIADDEVLLHLGELYIKQEAYEKAIPYLEAHLKTYPENKDTLLNIARCYEKLGHWEAALVGYKSALGE